MKNGFKIGIFDSGKGGLSVANEIYRIGRQMNLSINIDYLADFNNFPYGNKTKQELKKIIYSNVNHLYNNGNSVIIVACNTASIAGNGLYDELMKKMPIHIYKVTEGLSSLSKQLGQAKKMLVLGTNFTVKSKFYKNNLKLLNKNLRVYEMAAQNLVGYIEANNSLLIEKEVDSIKMYIEKEKIDSLFLGCTHYSFINNVFINKLRGVNILDPSVIVAKMTLVDIVEKRLKSFETNISSTGIDYHNYQFKVQNNND